ncbi:hypothetical protein TNCV_2918101 [Trichonephila clavipes]|nr:hypothetical protein TNCV_2918101 [Trichonephila clavipes]
MRLLNKGPTRVPLLIKRYRHLHIQRAQIHRVVPRISRRELSGWINHMSFITSIVLSGCAVFQVNGYSAQVQQVQAVDDGIILRRKFS